MRESSKKTCSITPCSKHPDMRRNDSTSHLEMGEGGLGSLPACFSKSLVDMVRSQCATSLTLTVSKMQFLLSTTLLLRCVIRNL